VQGRVVKLLLSSFFLWWSQLDSKNNKRSIKLHLLLSSSIYVVHGAVYTKYNLLFVFVCERHLVAKPKPASPPHRQRRVHVHKNIFLNETTNAVEDRWGKEKEKRRRSIAAADADWARPSSSTWTTHAHAHAQREKWWVFLWPHLTSDSFTSCAIQLFSFSLFVCVSF